jgi:hypothetical protein
MLSWVSPRAGTGDAERPESAGYGQAVVGLEPPFDFALSLVGASGPRIVDQDAPGDVLGDARAAQAAPRATAVLPTSTRWSVGLGRCLPRCPGAPSGGNLPVSLPRTGPGRSTGFPGSSRCAGRPWALGCLVARLFVRALSAPDGIVDSSNLPTSGRHGKNRTESGVAISLNHGSSQVRVIAPDACSPSL